MDALFEKLRADGYEIILFCYAVIEKKRVQLRTNFKNKA